MYVKVIANSNKTHFVHKFKSTDVKNVELTLLKSPKNSNDTIFNAAF